MVGARREQDLALPGPQRFLRYAFMPNQLGYCGGDDHRALFEYGLSGQTDGGLIALERQFEGAFPYLQLIAASNGIPDPLDARVVEAYWIGNHLLDPVPPLAMHTTLADRFRNRTGRVDWRWLAAKAPAGALPHHSFHVLEIFPRVGMLRSGAADHVTQTMASCCIRWGQVRQTADADLLVEAQPLEVVEGKLRLGPPTLETVRRWVDGRGFVDHVVPGDWVALHWSWACDQLTARQVAQLEHYTRHHIALCNATL